MSITRYASNPVINIGGTGSWKEKQVQEFIVIPDPADATKLIMFYAGEVALGTSNSIGRATATVADPFTWTDYVSNPVIAGDNRLDSIVDNTSVDGKLYLYSTVHGGFDRIDMRTSTDNGLTWSSNTICLSNADPGADESDVSQGSVWKVDATHWVMIYSCRGVFTGGTLKVLRRATSSNGITWTRATPLLALSVGASGPDTTYIEWHNIVKIGSTYVMSYEAYDGTSWSICIATSSDLITWTKSTYNPAFEKSGTVSAFDQYHVATPAFVLIGSTWYLFYQGGDQTVYDNSNWKGGMATLSGTPLDIVNPPTVTQPDFSIFSPINRQKSASATRLRGRFR